MAIDLATGFNIGSKDAIDERQVLTLEQMKNLDESIYPDKYFAICKDDSMLYVYNVNNPVDAKTGKFRKVSSNESVDPSIFQKINDDTLITEDKTIVGAINELKTGVSSISVPTQVSQLTNDSGYITSDEVDLIEEYNPDETYNEGQICLYNNYVWLCTTVTTGTFEESNWEKQTDNITELDLNTIKTFLGLTPEQLETMADIISSEIRTDKVFSSSETYTRIDNALKEAKQYCASQLDQKLTLLIKTELDKTNAKLGEKADKSYVDDKVNEIITNPTELDTDKYIKNGFYSIRDATKRTNLPMQNVGTLLVYYAGHYVIQEYILNENLRIFIRRSTDKGANWSAWQELATMDRVVQCVENKKPNAKTVSFELNSESWNCGTIYGNTHNGGNFKYDYYVTSDNIELVRQNVYGQQGGVTASLSGTTLTLTASENTTIKTVTIIKS